MEVFEAFGPREPAVAEREALLLAAATLGVGNGVSGLSLEVLAHLEETVASRDDCCAAPVEAVRSGLFQPCLSTA